MTAVKGTSLTHPAQGEAAEAAINGLYVGMLTDAELLQFERLIAAGRAARSYSGAGGLMGLAKVRIFPRTEVGHE